MSNLLRPHTLTVVLAAVLAFSAPVLAGHYEEHIYLPTHVGTGCTTRVLGPAAPGGGGVCFAVLPGESQAALRIQDVLVAPIAASYAIDDGRFRLLVPPTPFCESVLVPLPPGAAYVEVFPNGSGPGACSLSLPPTTGTVMGSFS